MSYVVDIPIDFVYTIKPYTTVPIPTAISLILQSHEGDADYDTDGITIGATYVAPTDTVAGSYSFTNTFLTPGSWRITLADGTAADHRVLWYQVITVIEGEEDIAYEIDINIPVY